jgi:hypothetical protein
MARTQDPVKKLKDRFWLWFLIAVLGLGIVPLVGAIAGEVTARMEAMKAEGRVGMGTITAIREVEEQDTGRRGRPRSRTVHYIDFTYDMNPSVSYADFVAAGETLPSDSNSGAISSYSRDSGSAEAEAHRVGQEVPVVVLADDMFEPELYTAVRDYLNWPNYLMMLGALIASLFCGWRSWVAWQELRAMRVRLL